MNSALAWIGVHEECRSNSELRKFLMLPNPGVEVSLCGIPLLSFTHHKAHQILVWCKTFLHVNAAYTARISHRFKLSLRSREPVNEEFMFFPNSAQYLVCARLAGINPHAYSKGKITKWLLNFYPLFNPIRWVSRPVEYILPPNKNTPTFVCKFPNVQASILTNFPNTSQQIEPFISGPMSSTTTSSWNSTTPRSQLGKICTLFPIYWAFKYVK